MDHRDRHQGGDDWRGDRTERPREQDDNRRSFRPSEPASYGGDEGYRPGSGDSTYATGRLSSTSGYGPQALGGGGHAISHEGGFGRENIGGGGRSYGYGEADTGRGRQGYSEGYGGERDRDRDAFGQGREAYGYPGARSAGGPQYGGDFGRDRGGDRPRGGGRPDQQPFGPGGGFGDGGAYRAGWGGQGDHQRHDDEDDHRGQGGGSYGQRDVSQGARRSQYRDDQRDGGGRTRAPDVWEAGYSGQGSQNAGDHDHEPDYRHWRESRLAEMDREHQERRDKHAKEWDEHYGKYREERRNSFGKAFEDWRSKLSGDGDKGSGSNRLATDSTDAEALRPTTAADGGAGMKGAGAVGGSSATMASGSAGSGAPNPSSGADTSGVTTGSENKADKPH